MTLAGLLLVSLGVFWIGGGTIWLLSNRSYRIYQAPNFLMDLLGFPVELAQRMRNRGA